VFLSVCTPQQFLIPSLEPLSLVLVLDGAESWLFTKHLKSNLGKPVQRMRFTKNPK